MRRYLTTALVTAVLTSATATVASADPLSALFGGLFGQRPAQQVSAPYYQPAATSAYAYAYARAAGSASGGGPIPRQVSPTTDRMRPAPWL